MAHTPEIDGETYALAMTYGYTIDIGQVTKEDKKVFDKQIRQGTIRKVRAWWPWLLDGTRMKMCYVKTGA